MLQDVPFLGTSLPAVLRSFANLWLTFDTKSQPITLFISLQFALVHLIFIVNKVHCEVSGRFSIVGGKIAGCRYILLMHDTTNVLRGVHVCPTQYQLIVD